MIPVKASLRTEGSIVSLEFTSDNKIFALDNIHNLTIIDRQNFSIIKRMNLVSKEKITHRYCNAFNSRNNLIFVPVLDKHLGIVFEKDILSIKRKAIISQHIADVESAKFSRNGEILATGGQDGRVFLFDTKDFTPIKSMPPRGDYINFFHFSLNDKLLLICGFDKQIVVLDVVRLKIIATIELKDVPEQACVYDDNKKILVILRNGNIVVCNVEDGSIIFEESLSANWPATLKMSSDMTIAFIGTRSNAIYAIQLHGAKIVKNEFFTELSGVASIAIDDDMLYLGGTDGQIVASDYKRGSKELLKELEAKNFKKAREILETNPMLLIDKASKIFNDAWPSVLQDCIKLITEEKIEEAMELAHPFLMDKAKQDAIDFYLKQSGNISTFFKECEKKEYNKAYAQIKIRPFLASTEAAKKMEAEWESIFTRAKKLLEEDPQNNARVAKELLNAFYFTPKKELIDALLHNIKLFAQCNLAIKNKDFKTYFSIVGQHQFLKSTPLYVKIEALGETLMDKFRQFEVNLDFGNAIEISNLLLHFPLYKTPITDGLVRIQEKEKFLNFIIAKDIKSAYILLADHDYLQSMAKANELVNMFLELYEKASVVAKEGNGKALLEILKDYLDINFWREKISSLFKILYIKQIHTNIENKSINWQNAIQIYVSYFGGDALIKGVCAKNNLDKVLSACTGLDSFDNYQKKEYIESLFLDLIKEEIQEMEIEQKEATKAESKPEDKKE